MRKLAISIAALTFGLTLSAAADQRDLSAILERIATDQPSFKWDAKSAVEGDFDGSRRASYAILGYKDKRVMVAVGRKAADGAVTTQYLEFGITPDHQDAICKLPAHLKTYPLACSADEPAAEEKIAWLQREPGSCGAEPG